MKFVHAWIIQVATGLLIVILSMPYIILGQTLEPKGATTALEVARLSPDLGKNINALIRVLGLSYLATGILYTSIALTAYRRGELWAWYSLWMLPIFYLGDIVNNLAIGGSAWMFDMVGMAVGILVLLVSPQFETILQRVRGT